MKDRIMISSSIGRTFVIVAFGLGILKGIALIERYDVAQIGFEGLNERWKWWCRSGRVRNGARYVVVEKEIAL